MVLGWLISVHRQIADRNSPAADGEPMGDRLAVWQTDWDGLEWVRELVDEGDAIHLADNAGYPMRYTVRAGAALPILLGGPPRARSPWVFGPTDIIDFDRWLGTTTLDGAAIDDCQADEWLHLQAWDES